MHSVIIGAGAAGLTCGGFAAETGDSVTILERNERPAKKVLITGKGRCNVTNACDAEEFLRNVRTNPRFLYSAIYRFPPQAVTDWFERLGVPLKVERGRRVFPVSDKAADIAGALTRFVKERGVPLMEKRRVESILTEGGQVTGVRCKDGESFPCDAAVIATGGCSYPRTGSTGDGYRLAQELGHHIIPPRPSLVSIRAQEAWCAQAAGLSLKNVTLTVRKQGGGVVYQELGEMLFTHTGVSGPLVLSASAYMGDTPRNYVLEINLKPGLSREQLDTRILRDFQEVRNKEFHNSLEKLLPRTLIPVIVQLSGIPAECKVHSVTREQRKSLEDQIQGLSLTPVGFGSMEEAVITAGGVDVKEVNPKTMESRLVKGLFFAGEVLDVDAFTGGYNLQIAFATGYAAAEGLKQKKSKEETGGAEK